MSAIHPDLHEETPATVYGAASFAIGAVEGRGHRPLLHSALASSGKRGGVGQTLAACIQAGTFIREGDAKAAVWLGDEATDAVEDSTLS